MPIQPDVQLNLTKDQYRALLELVLLGHRTADTPRAEPIAEYDQVEQLVLSQAERAGLASLVAFDDETRCHVPSEKLEEEALRPLREDYDEFVFWEELTFRLADRDMRRELGDRAVDAMRPEERDRAQAEYQKKYDDETVAHGVDRLEVRS